MSEDQGITRQDLEFAAKLTDEDVQHMPAWMVDIRDLARAALQKVDRGEATIESVNIPTRGI